MMIKINRRDCIGAGLGALAFAASRKPARASEAFKIVVTTTETPLIPNSVLELAADLGYYKQEGVDVEIVRVQQTPSAVAALVSKQGHMANISVDSALQLTARKQVPLKAVFSPNKSLPYLIAGRSSIKTIQDLAGGTFGVGRVGSLDHALSALVLRKNGIDDAAIRFVSLGQPNVRAQALAAGRIDATTMSIGVWLTIADQRHLRVLVPESEFYAAAPVLNKVNVVTDETLRSRADEIKAVTRAIIRLSRDFAREPQRWAEAMKKARPDVSAKDLEQLATAYRRTWSVNGGLNREEIAATIDWNYESDDFKGLPKVAVHDWIDFRILADVLKEVGVQPDQDPPLHS
ncbi:ABC transporter substrate-binding protein [Microvirga sp. M2]|uniref:ABC transporter substrate-binding protein n=1 Tax=Microvirga sp. M2 TaxID=3073270 RepID=UPI0039C11C10